MKNTKSSKPTKPTNLVKLLFLSVILVCSGIIFILSFSDLLSVNSESYKYVFATECLTLCLMACMFYLIRLED